MSGRAHELFQHPVFANGAFSHQMPVGIVAPEQLADIKTWSVKDRKYAIKQMRTFNKEHNAAAQKAKAEAQRAAAAAQKTASQKEQKSGMFPQADLLKQQMEILKKEEKVLEQMRAVNSHETKAGKQKKKRGKGPSAQGTGTSGRTRQRRQYSQEQTDAYLERCAQAETQWQKISSHYENSMTDMFYRDDFQALIRMSKMMRTRKRIAPTKDNAPVAEKIINTLKAQSKLRRPYKKAVRMYWKDKDESELAKLTPEIQERLVENRVEEGEGEPAESAAKEAAVSEVDRTLTEEERQERIAKMTPQEQVLYQDERGGGLGSHLAAAQPSILQRLNMI